MPTLKQGDLIKNRKGSTRKVLGVCGEVVHVSYIDGFDGYLNSYTEVELRNEGYTWDTPAWEPEIKEMYWYIYINDTGAVTHGIWANDEVDKARRDFLGIYQTSDLGEAALLEIRRKLGK